LFKCTIAKLVSIYNNIVNELVMTPRLKKVP